MTITMELGKIVKIQHLLMILTILRLGTEGNPNLIKDVYEKPMQSLFAMVIMVT